MAAESCSLQTVEKYVRALMKESVILKRVVYKNRNQHRRDRNFQKLHGLSKDLERFKNAQFMKLLYTTKGNTRSEENVTGGGSNCSLSDFETFLNQVIEHCKECFQGCRQQLLMSVFIHFNLLVSALICRVWQLASIVVKYIERLAGLPSSLSKTSTVQSTRIPLVVNLVNHLDVGELVPLTRQDAQKRQEVLMASRWRSVATTHTTPSGSHQLRPITSTPSGSCHLAAKPRARALHPNYVKVYKYTPGGLVILKSRHPRVIERISRKVKRRGAEMQYLKHCSFNDHKYLPWYISMKLK